MGDNGAKPEGGEKDLLKILVLRSIPGTRKKRQEERITVLSKYDLIAGAET